MWRSLRINTPQPHSIISTWIDEALPGQTKDDGELAARCIMEASGADRVIVYGEPGEVLKGALIEVGAALASDVEVVSVGRWDNWPRIFAKHPFWREAKTIQEAIDLPQMTLFFRGGKAVASC